MGARSLGRWAAVAVLSTGTKRRRGLRGFPWLLLRLGRAGGGHAFGVLSVWLGWERLTTWWWRLRSVRRGGVLRYSVTRHRSGTVRLSDGTAILPGDTILELHLDNPGLVRLVAADRWSPWAVLRLVAQDLDHLAAMVEDGEVGPVKAVHGITLFASAGRRLGFEVRPLPRTWRWGLVRFFLVGLLAVYHAEGWHRAARLTQDLWPGEVWMSKSALSDRFRT